MVCDFLDPYSGRVFDRYLYTPRLIEFAANYFDLASFPDGETKRALQRAWNKRAGKDANRGNGASANGPAAKKAKKNKGARLDGQD
jgi:pre-mRNA-splicing factor ATP-dependent RNA helicase DHX15/PRP43